MILACVTLVPANQQWDGDFRQVAAIDCAKGRGLILPGGKWEEGELFEETAYREFTEETGQKLTSLPKLFWQGYTLPGNYTYCFLGECPGFSPFITGDCGETRYALWYDLLQSQFRAYYSLLRQFVDAKGLYTGEH